MISNYIRGDFRKADRRKVEKKRTADKASAASSLKKSKINIISDIDFDAKAAAYLTSYISIRAYYYYGQSEYFCRDFAYNTMFLVFSAS